MIKRKIIKIDEDKCNGCGLCIPNCPEGALQIIDGKARIISDLFCDGLGACIGHCPQGAITTEEREAQDYDEKKVMENVVRQGNNVIRAHLIHLKEHRQENYLRQALEFLKQNNLEIPLEERKSIHTHSAGTCPSAKIMDFRKEEKQSIRDNTAVKAASRINNWPVQINLVPVNAPYLSDSDLLIAADCVPFAYADFHEDLLKNKILLVGCPKLDDAKIYEEKITQIFKNNNIRSVTCAHMEVPCCFGLVNMIKSAISASAKNIEYKEIVIGIKGDRKQ